jgi:hypothetical protein
MKLDAEGNRKAAAALRDNQNRANRAKDPKAPTEVTATVSGTFCLYRFTLERKSARLLVWMSLISTSLENLSPKTNWRLASARYWYQALNFRSSTLRSR